MFLTLLQETSHTLKTEQVSKVRPQQLKGRKPFWRQRTSFWGMPVTLTFKFSGQQIFITMETASFERFTWKWDRKNRWWRGKRCYEGEFRKRRVSTRRGIIRVAIEEWWNLTFVAPVELFSVYRCLNIAARVDICLQHSSFLSKISKLTSYFRLHHHNQHHFLLVGSRGP